MSNAKIYRDTHGRIWETRGNHYMAHLLRDRNGREVGFEYSSPIGRVRQLFGPIEQISADQGADRYSDADGDVWYRQPNGRYSMNRGGHSRHPGVPLATLEELSGPLVPLDDGEGVGDGPTAYRDREGDVWHRKNTGRYSVFPHGGTPGLTRDELTAQRGPLVDIGDADDPPGEMGERYRDAHGDMWHRMDSGKYTLMPDHPTPYGGSDLSEVRALYGPLVDAGEAEPERYTDVDGDTWEEDMDDEDTLRLVVSRTVHGAEFGVFADDPEDQADDTTADQRAEALTVGVMLAKMVHGDQGHPANVAGTADTLARFILGER